MASILYIGMDVHTTNHTVCAYKIGADDVFAETSFVPLAENIAVYLETLRYNEENPEDVEFICGYEAGCLGYSLYRELKAKGIDCRILAPSTMATSPLDNRKKNDRMDARRIAKCLAFGTYRNVYVPDEEDDAVKEYIRMRNDANVEFKKVKQQITAFCTRHSKLYDGTKHKWTKQHRAWLKTLEFENAILRETLNEYLIRLQQLEEKLAVYDKRIKEFSEIGRYKDSVKKLCCFKGIATHTALSMVTEIGGFQRFPSAQHFSSYLGLTPGEHSSGNSQHSLGITKAGNSHLRSLLIESAQCFNRGSVGGKSAALKERQTVNALRILFSNRVSRIRVIQNKAALGRGLVCYPLILPVLSIFTNYSQL